MCPTSWISKLGLNPHCFELVSLQLNKEVCESQRRRQEYTGPRANHDRAGPEYRYLDWYVTANTDYV